MAKGKKGTFTVDRMGVRVRGFLRGDRWWLDVRLLKSHDRKARRGRRFSANTSVKSEAEALALQEAVKMATESLFNTTPDTLTLGQLFAAYRRSELPVKTMALRKASETRLGMFVAAWGEDKIASHLSGEDVKSYCAKRRAGTVAPASRTKRIAAGRAVEPLRDGALDSDFRFLSSVFNWATQDKAGANTYLMSVNPLLRCKTSKKTPAWPREKEGNVRRPLSSDDRYQKTLEQADVVDATGALRLILSLVYFTARRSKPVRLLTVGELLLTPAQVEAAQASLGMELAPFPHGGIYWPHDTDKQGVRHITPISAGCRREVDLYMDRLAVSRLLGGGTLTDSQPLFPSRRSPALPLSRKTMYNLLMRAERLANVPKLKGGAFHPYRRLWAVARKHQPDNDVAAAGGWGSTITLKIYQRANATGVLAAVLNGTE